MLNKHENTLEEIKELTKLDKTPFLPQYFEDKTQYVNISYKICNKTDSENILEFRGEKKEWER